MATRTLADHQPEDSILALWLEGADGTLHVDQHSDIDPVCYAREGSVDDTIGLLENSLATLGPLDIVYEEPGRPPRNRSRAYHVVGTPDSLLLDATFQSESFPICAAYEVRMPGHKLVNGWRELGANVSCQDIVSRE